MNSQFGGGAWPVVQRELREAARGRWAGRLRLAGALGGVLVFWSVSSNDLAPGLGINLFDKIHALLLCLICWVVPALTADSIARERREGTLGLLFLTPLTGWGIVLGKTLAQVLRVFILCLAVVPVLSISFFLGGVTLGDLRQWVVVEIIVGMLCVAAGVLASSLARSRVTAFALTFLFLPFLCLAVFRGLLVRLWIQTVLESLAYEIGGVFTSTMPPVGMKDLAGWPCFAIAVVILLAALRLAGFCVNRSWRDKVPSVRRQNWVRRYCTPVFRRWFSGGMRRSLERNPIAWLQQYSWTARLSKWGLCLFFVILECFAIDKKSPAVFNLFLNVMLLMLAAAYTFAGVNGFFQEKKTGALELILITPLSPDQIIFGRIWGMWRQFLPATLLLAGADIAAHKLMPVDFGGLWRVTQEAYWTKDLEIITQFVTLPVVATCIALSAKNLFVASALTVFMVFAPDFIWLVISRSQAKTWPSPDEMHSTAVCLAFVSLVMHAWMTMFAYSHLRQRLDKRNYAFT